jgi:hypothetical protein
MNAYITSNAEQYVRFLLEYTGVIPDVVSKYFLFSEGQYSKIKTLLYKQREIKRTKGKCSFVGEDRGLIYTTNKYVKQYSITNPWESYTGKHQYEYMINKTILPLIFLCIGLPVDENHLCRELSLFVKRPVRTNTSEQEAIDLFGAPAGGVLRGEPAAPRTIEHIEPEHGFITMQHIRNSTDRAEWHDRSHPYRVSGAAGVFREDTGGYHVFYLSGQSASSFIPQNEMRMAVYLERISKGIPARCTVICLDAEGYEYADVRRRDMRVIYGGGVLLADMRKIRKRSLAGEVKTYADLYKNFEEE